MKKRPWWFVTYGFGDGLFYKADVVNEYLDKIEKSDSRPVSKTDLPKPEVPSRPVQVFPKSTLEIRSLQNPVDTARLGKVVGQLLASGNVTNEQSQNLLQHLTELAGAYGKLHLALWNIPFEHLRQADEAIAGRIGTAD